MKSLTDLLSDFKSARQAYEKLNNDLPRIIGNECVRAIKQNFADQGYDSGKGVQRWPVRAAATNRAYSSGRGKGKQGNYKGSVFSASKPLLLQTKALFNSIKYVTRSKSVFIGVDLTLVPYAKIHNEGGRGIPIRQYMPKGNEPPNFKMLRTIEKKLNSERDKAMKNFKK